MSAHITSVGPSGQEESIIKIPLTQGKMAIIDAADWAIVQPFKWSCHVKKSKNKIRRYARCRWKGHGRTITMHQLLLGKKPGMEIDHVNGNGLDNRRSNLRHVTRSMNNANQAPTRGTSRFKGVYWNKDAKKWQAQICSNKKRMYIGLFESEEDAALAYDARAKRFFGNLARLNFPGK